MALVAEAVADLDISNGTPALDTAPALDTLGGIQARLGRFRLTAAVLHHGRALHDGERHPSPLPGFVDLSRATVEDIGAYLAADHLAGGIGRIRPAVQIVAPVAPGAPLPAGARLIPDVYRISSVHQMGGIVVFGWHF